VAIASQDTSHFQHFYPNNIGYNALEEVDEAVLGGRQLIANALEFILEMDGFDTQLGDRGIIRITTSW